MSNGKLTKDKCADRIAGVVVVRGKYGVGPRVSTLSKKPSDTPAKFDGYSVSLGRADRRQYCNRGNPCSITDH